MCCNKIKKQKTFKTNQNTVYSIRWPPFVEQNVVFSLFVSITSRTNILLFIISILMRKCILRNYVTLIQINKKLEFYCFQFSLYPWNRRSFSKIPRHCLTENNLNQIALSISALYNVTSPNLNVYALITIR